MMVRQHLQTALDRETTADSRVITKKQLQSLHLLLPCLSAVLGSSVQDRHTGKVGRGEANTFSLCCFLLLAKSCILLGTGMSAGRKVGEGSVRVGL